MATWHQNVAARRAFKNKLVTRYDHPTQWTVVIDPPNAMRACISFSTEEQAKAYMAKVPHCYLMPPRCLFVK